MKGSKKKPRKNINVWMGGILGQVPRKELVNIARRYHVPRATALKKEDLVKRIVEIEDLLEETTNLPK